MIRASDITLFSMTEPDFLEILFRSAKMRRDTLVLRRDEWVARIALYRNLSLLASITQKFATLTTELRIDELRKGGELEEAYGHLTFLVSKLSELIILLQEKGMSSEALSRRSFQAFVRAHEELKADQQKWAIALIEDPIAKNELDTLLQQITPDNRHAFIDWGRPVGKEIW